MRVLVVDDDITVRTWLKFQLTKWHYSADYAENGFRALQLYQTSRHDLVITDWSMPGMDGLELIQKIRAMSPDSPPYFIMLSGKSNERDLVEGVESGADDYIIKPVSSSELKARLISAIRIRKLESQLRAKNKTLELANTQMKNDLLVAAKIQSSFLPHDAPSVSGINMEWGLLPCEELAGDALNIIQLDDHRLGVYVLDVSGHGVAAALMAMTLIHLLSPDRQNSILFHRRSDDSNTYDILPPSEVAVRLNQRFPMDDINGQYFTCIYGIMDQRTLQFTYTAAGHPGPVHVGPGRTGTSHDTTGMPIGFFPGATYEDNQLQLEPGDRVYMFSDGIPETTNKYDEQFGTERTISHVQTAFDEGQDLRTSVDELATAALKWNGLSAMKDDVSIIGLEVPVDPPPTRD